MDGQEYRYYAFISYSRRDEKWARWLQRKLETYRLPASVRKSRQGLPKRLFPVFRDKTDLSGGHLEDALEQQLAQSRFLIVICSPDSAASQWVDREVSAFIRLGREARIIPLIVAGSPNGTDGQPACFCPALRQQVSKALLGVSVPEYGRTSAFLRVASAMLGVQYDELYRRHTRRVRRRAALAALTALCLGAAVGGTVWYNMPHSAYYADVVTRWEIPEGIYPLTESQRQGLNSFYRITTQRGKVIRLERVNSAGAPVEPLISRVGDVSPVTEFLYDSDGDLSRAELRDENGQVTMRKVFSLNLAESQIAVDYQQPYNNGQALTLAAETTVMNDSIQRSGIVRQLNTYDENGFLIRTMYQQDALNHPAHDAAGVYGVSYERNELGQTVTERFLDENGQARRNGAGVAAWVLEYDENGRLCRRVPLDEQGEPIQWGGAMVLTLKYDELGNLIVYQTSDKDGRPVNDTEDGFSWEEYTYDERGFLVGLRLYDSEGEPAYALGEGVHGYLLTCDERGCFTRIESIDTDGNPTVDMDGVAQEEYTYDEQGRKIQVLYRDLEGELTCLDGIYAGVRIEYDENGYRRSLTYLDAEGQPLDRWDHYTTVVFTNDANGNMLRREYLDVNGELMDYKGLAVAECAYDAAGNRVEGAGYRANGQLAYVNGMHGVTKCTYENGKMTSRSYYDEDGAPNNDVDGCHMLQMEYDEYGNCVRSRVFSTDGENVYPRRTSWAECRMVCDEYGRVAERAYYDGDGEPYYVPQEVIDGWTVQCWKMQYTYDSRENLSEKKMYVVEDGRQHVITLRGEYDDRGNLVSRQLDRDGEPVTDGPGVCVTLFEYDERGLQVSKRCLDADGEPCVDADGTYMVETDYDERGQISVQRNYSLDEAGEPYLEEQITCRRNAQGEVISIEYRDGDGALVDVRDMVQVVRYKTVSRTDSGYAQGLRDGDVVLTQGSWRYFDYADGTAAVEAFSQFLSGGGDEDRERWVTVARQDGNGGWTFLRVQVGPGKFGVRIVNDNSFDWDDVQALKQDYDAWLAEHPPEDD